MSKVICPLCSKEMVVRSNAKNIMIIDGVIMHKKCPKEPIDKQTAEEYKELKDKIKYYIVHKSSKDSMTTGFNWFNITNKIKTMKDNGYSYTDISYALDETVKLQNYFYGMGAVVNNIDRIIYQRNKKDEIRENITSNEVKDNVDLKVIEDDIDW